MQQRREHLLEEIHKAEHALNLLRELEQLLQEETKKEEERPVVVGRYVTQLERLAQSLPEGHSVRLSIESALRPELVGSVSRSRSAIEGEVWTLRGALHYHSS